MGRGYWSRSIPNGVKVLVCANNPGGANAILPVVAKLGDFIAVLEDKAKDYFTNKDINFIDGDTITDEGIQDLFNKNNFELFLAGTSDGQTIDKKLLLECKKRNIKSVYILDFWSNYWQRFSSQDNKDFKYLPDYICVMDEKAKKEMIAGGFNAEIIKITGNPHFDHFTDGITLDSEEDRRVLFVSQPIKNTGLNFDEFQVLQDIIEVLPAEYNLVVRLHPRDEQGKFDDMGVRYDEIDNLEKSISASQMIIGMNSVVLLQSAMADKNVISYQPGLDTVDTLISNDLGLSRLVTVKEELKSVLMSGKNQILEKNVVIKNATNNVLDLIKNL